MKKTVFPLFLLLLLGLAPLAQGAIISTEYSGTVSGFHKGPFATGGQDLSLSFQWDSSAPSDGTQFSTRTYWNNAATNLVLDIGGYQVTGSGYVRNLDNGASGDVVEIRLGSFSGFDYGTIDSAPAVNGYDFWSAILTFRSLPGLMFPGDDHSSLIESLPVDLESLSLTVLWRSQADQTFTNLTNPLDVSFTMSGAESIPAPGPL
ncbi:MAG: hypothetical protein ACPG4N_09435, partial [Gammaproteobacteria bacterium]